MGALWKHIAERLKPLGVESFLEGINPFLKFRGNQIRVRLDDQWEEGYRTYLALNDTYFDEGDWTFTSSSVLDVPLSRLDTDFYRDEELVFANSNGDEVCIKRASYNYIFAFFDSEAYIAYFESLVADRLSEEYKYGRGIAFIFRSPVVATFRPMLALSPASVKPMGFECIRACLAKLAIEKDICYEISGPSNFSFGTSTPQSATNWVIPSVVYDKNLISYYKVGKASPFSSQSFLAYYHVLEYYFLRVAEDSLHHRLRGLLNEPSFYATTDSLDRAISLIRKHDANDDETEMLRKVLIKFVAEEDFIAFVSELEAGHQEKKIYTRKTTVFGESFEISLREGHALSNAAKLLKHIRNAIVHSSDKYNREECHIPLTASEAVIFRYIPIVKYFAERVIFSTATPRDKEYF